MPKAGFYAIESHAIRFGKDGRWYADGEPIEHPRIAALFSRHLTQDEDGAFWLVIGDERARIEVEDTPFVVIRVDGGPETGFTITLNDGSSEPLAANSLRFGDADVLYCAAKGGRYRVRFLRAPQADLLAHARAGAAGTDLPVGPGQVWTLPSGS